jgi:nicotinate-nucleotide pyrophosphorylase (carboxylating)
MDVETLRRAVELAAGRALLEASGGITLGTVRAVAETGVDLISVGALTHSAPALDLSLEFDRRPSVPPRGPARDIGPTIHDVG